MPMVEGFSTKDGEEPFVSFFSREELDVLVHRFYIYRRRLLQQKYTSDRKVVNVASRDKRQ